MENQQTYWNRVADAKTFTTPLDLGLFREHVPLEAAVFDFGCGYGRTLAELHDAGYRNLTGTDFSAGLVERAHREHPGLDVRLQTTSRLAFPDGSFDCVLLFAVLTCIEKNEEQSALRNELRRVLRPGGVLYVNDFLLNRDERNLDRYRAATARHSVWGVFELPDGAVLRHHDPAYIREWLKPFETIHFETVTYPTMNGHTSNGFFFFGRNH